MKLIKVLVSLGVVAASISVATVANASTSLSGAMTADNAFFAFLGTDATSLGTQIRSGNNWGQAFALTSTALTPGVTNYLNIEAINYGGPGGLNFVLNLSNTGFQFANGGQVLTTDSSNLGSFTGTYNNANYGVAVQPWVTATGAVIQDTGYGWGNVAGTSNWADASTNGLNVCGYCTVDFTVAITPGSVSGVPESSTWTMMLLGFTGLGFAGYRRNKGANLAA
jgi:hypothetical protein